MKKRKLLLGANWKMNQVPSGAFGTTSPFRSQDPEVVVFPTFLDLSSCIGGGLRTGAQCGRAEESGAFTGAISMKMLADRECTHVLCGHSERRTSCGETDADVAMQVTAALDVGLTPVICIGETAEEHATGKSKKVLERQLEVVVSKLKAPSSELIFAYEPVWAISGGNGNAVAMRADEAQEMHACIRSLLPTHLRQLRIIYGGSMKSSNAEELLKKPDIDGGLVGNASLNPEEFGKIVEIAKNIRK